LMQPEDPEDEPDLVTAKEELDELRERRWQRMNDFEKSTLLNFYTNYYLTLEDYPGAIRTFEEILLIEELREDIRLRTLRSLGQLYASEEDWQNSIDNYVGWRELSLEEDDIVYRGLSYAHFQLEEFSEALPYWIAYMEFLLDAGEPLDRNDYSYLNGIYFTLEDFDNAIVLTKTMIMLFDDPTDWTNLMSLYASIDDEDRRIQSLNLAYLKGHMDDEGLFLNLGQSMAGLDIPASGSKIILAGLDTDFIEQTEDNLQTYGQMYLLASMWTEALEPVRRVAEISDSGDGYDTLGYIHYVMTNYEEAAEAFQQAIDKGNLSDRADTLMFLSRSLLELNDFEAALDAATEAADIGDERDQDSANTYITFINSTKSRFDVLAERRQLAIDFYETYPALN
ncbi:MAG: tetratricopeptide repeat protein, partial [Gammaproteobacteria bacterium]|nr:tetratricopeptide repeat protein [Gammaproteobacteria bacterium]